MSDLVLVAGEFGFNIDITIIDKETGSPADLTDYDANTLDVKPTDYGTAVLAGKALTKPAGTTGVLRWVIASTDWPSTGGVAGQYYAQVEMLDTGTKLRRTEQFDLKVERQIG